MLRQETFTPTKETKVAAPETTGIVNPETTGTPDQKNILRLFEEVKQKYPDTEQILRLIFSLGPHPIPHQLLTEGSSLSKDAATLAILQLAQSGLIKQDENNAIRIDALTKQVLHRSQPIPPEDARLMVARAIPVLTEHLALGSHSQYFEHAKHYTLYAEKLLEPKDYMLIVKLLEKCGDYITSLNREKFLEIRSMYYGALNLVWLLASKQEEIDTAARIAIKLHQAHVDSEKNEFGQIMLQSLPEIYASLYTGKRLTKPQILDGFNQAYQKAGHHLELFFSRQTDSLEGHSAQNHTMPEISPNVKIIRGLIACLLNQPIPIELLMEASQLTKEETQQAIELMDPGVTYQKEDGRDIITLSPISQNTIREEALIEGYLKNLEESSRYLNKNMNKYIANYPHHIFFFLEQLSLPLPLARREKRIEIGLLWAQYAEFIARHFNELRQARYAYSAASTILTKNQAEKKDRDRISFALSDIISRLAPLEKTHSEYTYACDRLTKTGKNDIAATLLFARRVVTDIQLNNPRLLSRMYREIEKSCGKDITALLTSGELHENVKVSLAEKFSKLEAALKTLESPRESNPPSEKGLAVYLLTAHTNHLRIILTRPKETREAYVNILTILRGEDAGKDIAGPIQFIEQSLAIIPTQIVAPARIVQRPNTLAAASAARLMLPPAPRTPRGPKRTAEEDPRNPKRMKTTPAGPG
ncbi:MAG TPA: hypothetical protein VNC84_00270 [Gammaproteobacteria bacterium]|jgi:hypothetical protein|nr:hypothetical protein [Gammaproteobacteria bacterium]